VKRICIFYYVFIHCYIYTFEHRPSRNLSSFHLLQKSRIL